MTTCSARVIEAHLPVGLLHAVRHQQSVAVGDLIRSTNEMYKEYGVGRVQKAPNGLAKIEFNPSVFMKP